MSRLGVAIYGRQVTRWVRLGLRWRHRGNRFRLWLRSWWLLWRWGNWRCGWWLGGAWGYRSNRSRGLGVLLSVTLLLLLLMLILQHCSGRVPMGCLGSVINVIKSTGHFIQPLLPALGQALAGVLPYWAGLLLLLLLSPHSPVSSHGFLLPHGR